MVVKSWKRNAEKYAWCLQGCLTLLLRRGTRRVCQVSITNCSTQNPDDIDSESSGCFGEESKREKCRNGEKEKGNKSYMEKLTVMCLEEHTSRIHRTKIETLVIIHVHQKDLFEEIQQEAKTHKINDATDFDWMKNTRIYWKMDEEHIRVSITDVEFIYITNSSYQRKDSELHHLQIDATLL